MSSTADALTEVRPKLATLFRHALSEHGSKMTAYEAVARTTGTSSSWVRKALGDHGGVGLSFKTFTAIMAGYVRLCERIDADTEQRRRVIAALRGNAHAASHRDWQELGEPARRVVDPEADQ